MSAEHCTECGSDLGGGAFSKRVTSAGRIATCSLPCHEGAQQSGGRGTAYRLTEEDERRILERLTDSVHVTVEPVALNRLGAHAIGCSAYDLRDVELLWIGARVAEVLAAAKAGAA